MSELASKAIQPIVFLVLANLLTPEDFGVMSAALIVIGFSQIFWEAGMSKALIQKQENIDDAANVAFWMNLVLGGAIAAALYLLAEVIARAFFKDERVILVLQVMVLQVILGSLSAVHTALLQKEMEFKSLFWVRFAAVSLPGLASIPLAWKGIGYWALLAGALLGQVIQVIVLWRLSEWRPRRAFNIKVAKEMATFGVWVSVSGLLAWLYMWADSLIVGMYLGSRELGLYQIGNQVSAMIFAILFGPIIPVLYSHISSISQHRERIQKATQMAIKSISFVSIPIGMTVSLFANPLSLILFGDSWLGVEKVIGVMALLHGITWIIGMNGEIYRAMGKPSVEAIVSAVPLPVYAAAYLYSIPYGLETFLWARLGVALGGVLLHLLVVRTMLSISAKSIFHYLIVVVTVCAISTTGVRDLLIEHLHEPWWQVFVGAPLNLVVVAGVLFVLERNGLLGPSWPFWK